MEAGIRPNGLKQLWVSLMRSVVRSLLNHPNGRTILSPYTGKV